MGSLYEFRNELTGENIWKRKNQNAFQYKAFISHPSLRNQYFLVIVQAKILGCIVLAWYKFLFTFTLNTLQSSNISPFIYVCQKV